MANGSIRLDADFSPVTREIKKTIEHFNGLDKGLSSASNSVNGLIDDFKKAGSSMTTMDNKSVALAGALGKIDTSAKNPRKSLSELKKILEETTVSYNKLTDQEKASPFGKALKSSIEQLTDRAKTLKHELSEVNRTLSETKTQSLSKGDSFGGFDFRSMTSGALKFAGTLGLVTSAATLVSNTITNNVETAKNFEKSMSTLASLTGLGGEALDTLKRKAIEMGANTTQSATQAADAMAMIGSKRPDLLNSAYALADVTQSAITLSEAAGMEVPDAAEALSASLNIFQMESSEATRVINVLAAGSKKGAAGIQELGDIVFRAGGSAKKAGLSFEEFAGAAEIIRPAFGTAEDAGQAFNKFLQMLESKMDSQYKPSVVGFEQAMRNLKDANLGSTESMKLFTINGVKAYDAIMANIDGLGEMIKGVTGTNTAFEQASQNTDNFQGSMDSLSSAWEGFNLAINSSNGALKAMVDWLTDCVTWATNTFTELGRIKAKMDEINGVKENGPTRVDKNVRYIRNAQGSTPEEKKADAERRRATVNRNLDSQIKPLEEFVKAYNEADGKKLAQLRKTYKQIGDRSYNSIKAETEALKQVRGEFNARADEFIKGIGKKPTTETTTTTSITPTKEKKTEEQQNAESIRKLTEEYIKATDVRKAAIRSEIKTLQERNDEIKRLKDEAQGKEEKTEEQQNAESIRKLSQEYIKATDERKAAIRSEIKTLQERNDEIKRLKDEAQGKEEKIEVAIGFSGATNEAVDAWIKSTKDSLSRAEFGTDLYNSLTSHLADVTSFKNLMEQWVKAGLDASQFPSEELWEKIIGDDGDVISDKTWQKLVDEINAKLSTLDIQPIKIDFTTGKIDKVKEDSKVITTEWNAAGNAISAVGNALNQIEDPAAKVMGTIAQAIATVALSYSQALSSAATAGPWAWLAFAATGAATMMSSISAIRSATSAGSFAEGGVIGGRNYTDQITARVSSGEMVINEADQKRLYDNIHSGNFGGNSSAQPHVTGEMIYLGMNNFLKRTGKGEIVTSRR